MTRRDTETLMDWTLRLLATAERNRRAYEDVQRIRDLFKKK